MVTEITELNHSTQFSHMTRQLNNPCSQLEESYWKINYSVTTKYMENALKLEFYSYVTTVKFST